MIDIDPYPGYVTIYKHYVGKIFISPKHELPTGLYTFIKPLMPKILEYQQHEIICKLSNWGIVYSSLI